MRVLGSFALVVTLAACDSPITYSGYQMEQYFPFDGLRTWEYVSTDTSLPYKLVATLDPSFTTEQGGDIQVYRVSYEYVCVSEDPCTPAWVRDVLWSSDGTYGTRIWGFDTAGGTVSFDPSVQVTDGEMVAGASVVTDTGGDTWTSTFVGVETCPVIWTQEWGDRCVHLHLDDGDGDDDGGSWVAGHYWVITNYNVVGMELTDDTGQWQLSYATYAVE